MFAVHFRTRLVIAALAVAAALAAVGPIRAGPMGFADSWMAMGEASEDWREGWVNYAVTGRDAIGAGALFMRSDNGVREREFVEATYTRRLLRINAPHAQTNLWLLAGAGPLRGNDFRGTRTMVSPGVQFDWETRRLYAAARARAYRADGINHDYAAVLGGFSFYDVDYHQIQPWLVLEARRMRGLSDGVETTALARFIHRRWFIEVGINQDRKARLNAMFIL